MSSLTWRRSKNNKFSAKEESKEGRELSQISLSWLPSFLPSRVAAAAAICVAPCRFRIAIAAMNVAYLLEGEIGATCGTSAWHKTAPSVSWLVWLEIRRGCGPHLWDCEIPKWKGDGSCKISVTTTMLESLGTWVAQTPQPTMQEEIPWRLTSGSRMNREWNVVP